MSLSALADAILPWADMAHPDKAAQVRAHRDHEPTFRRWLGRLVEIRYEADPEWRKTAPLALLQETGLVVRMQTRGGEVIQVCGRYAPKPWVWTFAELATIYDNEPDPAAAFRMLHAAKVALDLRHETKPLPPQHRLDLTDTKRGTIFTEHHA